jgi:hypothetical protein
MTPKLDCKISCTEENTEDMTHPERSHLRTPLDTPEPRPISRVGALWGGDQEKVALARVLIAATRRKHMWKDDNDESAIEKVAKERRTMIR